MTPKIVVKKTGLYEDFNVDKVIAAVNKSARRVCVSFTEQDNEKIRAEVIKLATKSMDEEGKLTVQQMHHIAETALKNLGFGEVWESYASFRNWKTRQARILKEVLDKEQVIRFRGDKSNANTDDTLVSTKRCLVLNEYNKEVHREFDLPRDIFEALKEGYIYEHDQAARRDTFNCQVARVADIMRGGFEMGNIHYNEPKTLDTAFDVLGDIILSNAAQQYGGYTVPRVDTMLAYYAEKSFNKYKEEFLIDKEAYIIRFGLRDLVINLVDYKENVEQLAIQHAWKRVKREAEQGYQGIEIKLNTVASSRGDYPFVTFTFGLGTSDFEKLISETILEVHQEGQGETGKKRPVLFPKLVFLYDEELHGEGKELEDLFDKAIECSSYTMYPDYLSLTGEGYVPSVYKEHHKVISPMGCVRGVSKVKYRVNGIETVESIESFWKRFCESAHPQANRMDYYIDLNGVEIWDHKVGWTKCYRLIRNIHEKWCKIVIGDKEITCTDNHIFTTENRGDVTADEIAIGDIISTENNPKAEVTLKITFPAIEYSYDVTTESEHFTVNGIYSHNCRSFVSPWYERGGMEPADENDEYISEGRNNVGVVSLNLPMIYMKSVVEDKDFFEVLDVYLEMIRFIHNFTYEYLGQLHASCNPLSFCEGGLWHGNLKPNEKIAPVLKQSTASFGITALNELEELANQHSIYEDGSFSEKVLQYINDYVNRIKKEDGHLYSLYGTPAESLCFIGSTIVQAYPDNKRIDNIQEGDYVYSLNEETRKVELKKVLFAGKTGTDREVLKVTTNKGQEFICTPGHLFAVKNAEGEVPYDWVLAEDLEPGMTLVSNVVSAGDDGYIRMGGQCVHDIIAEALIGERPSGYVVNHKSGYKLDNRVENLEYVESSDVMKPPTKVIEDSIVISIEKLTDHYDVYDITVEDNHNFFVGGMKGVLVHNCGTQREQFVKKYGPIKGVTDYSYFTNSFHCHVTEKISGIEKQDSERRFWNYMNGGKIQYCRYPSGHNKEAIKAQVKRAMVFGFYEGVNIALVYCADCGAHIKSEPGEDVKECPHCGSKNLTEMDRVCGYLGYKKINGDTRLNAAKVDEVEDRISM